MTRKDKIKIEISLEEYEELLKTEAKMQLLEDSGLDTWDWLRDLRDELEEEYAEIEDMLESFTK